MSLSYKQNQIKKTKRKQIDVSLTFVSFFLFSRLSTHERIQSRIHHEGSFFLLIERVFLFLYFLEYCLYHIFSLSVDLELRRRVIFWISIRLHFFFSRNLNKFLLYFFLNAHTDPCLFFFLCLDTAKKNIGSMDYMDMRSK